MSYEVINQFTEILRFKISMKGMLELAMLIDLGCGDIDDGGGGGNSSGGVLEVLWCVDLSIVARRGAQNTVVGEGETTGCGLHLLDSRGKPLRSKEGGSTTSMIVDVLVGS